MTDHPVDRCADCGREIVDIRGRWAHRVRGEIYDTTCRMTMEDDMLLAADYHHVHGEPQRTFRAPRADDGR
jgi:hypothetical protein